MARVEPKRKYGWMYGADEEDGQRDAPRAHFVIEAAEGVRMPVDHEVAIERAKALQAFRETNLSFLIQ
jgi:hypothetical protein